MINLGWIVKCAFHLGGGTSCSEFIIHVIVQNKVPIFDYKEKMRTFNEYFVLQSKLPVANTIPSVMRSASEEQVLELMKGVDISEACGKDGVGNKIIKLCSEGFHVYFYPLH